jgi:hypothetical protein
MRTHGSNATYSAGCRCPQCTLAHRLDFDAWRHARYGKPVPDHVQHGRVSTYNNWGCRCDECSAAISAYQHAYRSRVESRKARQARRARKVAEQPVSEQVAFLRGLVRSSP